MRPTLSSLAWPLGVSLLALLCVTSAARAETAHTAATAPTIAVTGEGEVDIPPDLARVSITIDSDAPTSAAAGADNAQRMQSVVAALRAAGARDTDIATAAYSVQPQWQYSASAPPRRTGYRASMQLRLTVSNLQRLGPWIDAALSGGASSIGQVNFDSSQLQSARQQALTLAVQHARADASTVARAAGGNLGALLDLSTQPSSLQPGVLQQVVVAAERRAQGTSFQNTQLQVRAVVLARWSFVPAPP